MTAETNTSKQSQGDADWHTQSTNCHPLIVVDDASISINRNAIIDQVSIQLFPGEMLGILGPNGAGKSTLLKMMAGLIKPDKGNILLQQKQLAKITATTRARKIAYTPQQPASHPFTAIEMVLMGRYPHLQRFQLENTQDRAIAEQAMQQTETLEFKNRRIDTLSGGERQRTVLARALAQQADALLMDEPASSLDVRHQLLCLNILKNQAHKHNKAVSAVMHDINLAARFCDRIAVMHKGQIIQCGTPQQIITPNLIKKVFRVNTRIHTDPKTNRPQITLLNPTN